MNGAPLRASSFSFLPIFIMFEKKNHLFLEAFQCMFLELVLEGMMERGREKLCGWKNCPVTSDRGNESEGCIIVLRHNSLISNANSPQ